jgi:hypothetical protein
MVYIGSTTQSLAKRIGEHKSYYKRYLMNGKGYTSSYEIIKYPDVYIELVELCPCNNRMELCKREGQIIRTTENTTNRQIPGRTRHEYITDNTTTIKEWRKTYRADHADAIKEQTRQYRADNADTIKEQKNKKHNCQCGGKYTKQNRSRHLKSPKHQSYQTIIEFILS